MELLIQKKKIMFLAEFKRRYEKELLKNPDLQRFYVSTDPDKNKIVNQRDYIESSYYRKAKRKTKRNNKLIATSDKDPRAWNSELREILGGAENTNPTTTRKGIITGNDSPKMKAAKYRKTITDRKVPVNNPRNTFSTWNEDAVKKPELWNNSNLNVPDPWENTVPRKNIATYPPTKLKQQLALPPSRNISTTITNTQIPRKNINQTTNSAKNMPPLRRTQQTTKPSPTKPITILKPQPHTPIKPSGVNKYLVGGVAAVGVGLAGVGAYSLYQNNRNKDKKKR